MRITILDILRVSCLGLIYALIYLVVEIVSKRSHSFMEWFWVFMKPFLSVIAAFVLLYIVFFIFFKFRP